MRVIVHRLAAKEFQAARRWYRKREASVEDRFVEAVEAAVSLAATLPETAGHFRERYRWLKTRRFPFIVYFSELDESSVAIHAIAHKRRKPGYWLKRPDRP